MATTVATFNGDNKTPLGTATIPEIDGGWWVSGVRKDTIQSWERPFKVILAANDRSDFKGRMMFVDTGEAFSYFEQRVLTMSAGPDMSSLLGAFGMPMPLGLAEPPVPEIKVPAPHTGRPEQRFPGIGKYLDCQTLQWVGTDEDGSQRKLYLLGEELIGETEEEARRREEGDAQKLRLALATISGHGSNYIVNGAMNRTVMRTYRFVPAGGQPWMMLYGAQMMGHDTYSFPSSTGITSLPSGSHPFGQGTRGNADIYDVEWMATRRFGGVCPMSDDTEQFKEWVLQLFRTARLAPAVKQEMEDLKKAFMQSDSEQHQRDIEGLRKLNSEMREESRRKQEIADWEDARRRQRKEDSDRRIREGWSAVIRGVDQYRGPNGELIEIPIGGPGSRAYYDRFSGTILHTDGYPSGWEELPRWQW